MSKNESENHPDRSQRPSLGRVFASALASLFGVQSGRNQERDFAQGRPWVYVVVGVTVTVIFILAVWFVVRTVLRSAGV